MRNISVFCGAHEGNNPRYAEDAKKIGEILAAKGINVVFGGGASISSFLQPLQDTILLSILVLQNFIIEDWQIG